MGAPKLWARRQRAEGETIALPKPKSGNGARQRANSGRFFTHLGGCSSIFRWLLQFEVDINETSALFPAPSEAEVELSAQQPVEITSAPKNEREIRGCWLKLLSNTGMPITARQQETVVIGRCLSRLQRS